jgi:hypothetical protein
MEEQAPPAGEVRLDLPGASWPAWRWLALLLVLVAGLRAWQLCHTEVASRDSIAYIRYAWRLEHEPWPQVVRTAEHHPAYPFAVYFAAKPVCRLLPDDKPRAMQLASQLVSCAVSLLLVFPMFFLGRELFDARVGFWATLLYQCLPAPGRVLADGLSDPLFLLFAATSVWMALLALRTGRPLWFALVGLTSALGYLTRTEGLLVAPVTAVVLLGLQRSARWRRPWGQVRRCGASLVVLTAVLAVPFMILIGGLSLKPGVNVMIGRRPVWPPPMPAGEEQSGLVVSPLPLAIWKFGPHIGPNDRWGWAAWALAVELYKGFFHFLGLPALLGLYLFRRRFLDVPGAWVTLGCGACLSLLLYRLGQSNGYLGERHVLFLVMGGTYFAVAALALLGGWLARVGSRWRPGLSGSAVSLAILVLLTLAPLGRTTARLHSDREGFKQAGLWLAVHAGPDDDVMDPFAWAKYHAGLEFQPAAPWPPAFSYVVMEESKNKHPHIWYKLMEARQRIKDYHGEPVRRFPMSGTKGGEVVVYRCRMRG